MDNYSFEEVEALVEGYFDLSEYKTKLKILVRLADLERVFPRLPQAEKQALLFHTMMGMPADRAGKRLGCSPATVERRCRSGLERLVNLIHGRGI